MVEAIPLSFIGLFTLTLIFAFVRQYLLWRRREVLMQQPSSDVSLIDTQMAPYARRLTLRLVLLIYVAPIAFLTGMILFLTRG